MVLAENLVVVPFFLGLAPQRSNHLPYQCEGSLHSFLHPSQKLEHSLTDSTYGLIPLMQCVCLVFFRGFVAVRSGLHLSMSPDPTYTNRRFVWQWPTPSRGSCSRLQHIWKRSCAEATSPCLAATALRIVFFRTAISRSHGPLPWRLPK